MIPLYFLPSLPKVGQPCLLNIKDDHIIDTYFYEAPGREFHVEIAEVLHVSEQGCKLRDADRKTYIWSAKHSQEVKLFSQIKRSSKVIISSIDDVIIKLSLVAEQQSNVWTQLVQEQNTIFQIERARKADPTSLPIFDGKD